MAEVPETRFAETSGGYIAYQVVGDGPVDILVAHTAAFPIDLMWEEPSLVRFLDRLSSFSRHVWFDPRGRGASDPAPQVEERLAETIADDMLALVFPYCLCRPDRAPRRPMPQERRGPVFCLLLGRQE